MLKYFSILLFLLASTHSFGSSKDTIWNQSDNQGRKQGYWRVTYENGKIKYQGFFKDNKPLGEMKKYYESGALKAIQEFTNDKKSKVKLYYQNGVLAGEGNFIESEKDSIWKYYSYYDKTLILDEKYIKGVKEGYSRKYYVNGNIAEEILWHNNLKQGPWNQYYNDGTRKLSANYINDIRNGSFQTFYPGGKIETKGNFENNVMQGEWSYYDENGKVKTKIIYMNGVAKNADEIQKQDNEYFKLIDNNKGKFPEPDENNILK
jgi:antitoxin component YwqK of YwqJK toxin-antitoxin module